MSDEKPTEQSNAKQAGSHTPGPWTHYNDSSNPQHRHLIAATGKTIAHIYCTNGDEHQDAANARMIAAAPDLLAACKAVDDTCPCDRDINARFDAAWGLLLAAIAKAEGR